MKALLAIVAALVCCLLYGLFVWQCSVVEEAQVQASAAAEHTPAVLPKMAPLVRPPDPATPGEIAIGMTKAQVRAMIGEPAVMNRDAREGQPRYVDWIYSVEDGSSALHLRFESMILTEIHYTTPLRAGQIP